MLELRARRGTFPKSRSPESAMTRSLALSLIVLIAGLAVACERAPEPAPAPRAATPLERLLERIPPFEATEEQLDAWFHRLALEPAEIPESCRTEEGQPTAAERRRFEALFARRILEEFPEPPALPGLEEALETLHHDVLDAALEIALHEAAVVTPMEIAAQFEADPGRFARDDIAYFDFFFVPLEDEADRSPPERMQALADLAASGASVAEVKHEAAARGIVFSERSQRGVRGRLRPDLAEAVFSAPEEEFSDPVRLSNGWQLLYVHQIREGESPDLKAVTPRIRNQLQQERVAALREEVRQVMREELDEEGGAPLPDDQSLERAFARHLYADRAEALARIEEVMRNNAIAQSFVFQLLEREWEFSGDERREQFEAHTELYQSPAEYTVMEALVELPTEADFPSPVGRRDAQVELRRRIMEWTARLHEEGRTLADREESPPGFPVQVLDRGTEAQGPRGRLLDTSVQDLQPGEFSMPMPGRQHFHVFQLIDIHPAEPLSFEEATERIDVHLRMRALSDAYEAMACAALNAGDEEE